MQVEQIIDRGIAFRKPLCLRDYWRIVPCCVSRQESMSGVRRHSHEVCP